MEGRSVEGEEAVKKGRGAENGRRTYHDDERVPVEEPSIQVRDESDRERTDGSRYVALVSETRAREVVRNPSNAGNHHEQILASIKENKRKSASRSPSPMPQAVRTSSLRSYGA